MPDFGKEIFIGQDVRIRRWIKRDLSGATSPRIYYMKPDKTKGFWTAVIDGQDIYYDLPASANDQAGVWKFQAYYEVGTKKYKGSISQKEFLNDLT